MRGGRFLIVLCVVAALTALALVSGAGGSTTGEKYKIKVNAGCSGCFTLKQAQSIVVVKVGDSRTCRPFVDSNGLCNFWTGRAGTKVVLKSTADKSFVSHVWTGDCTGTGDCKLTMNANKFVTIFWST